MNTRVLILRMALPLSGLSSVSGQGMLDSVEFGTRESGTLGRPTTLAFNQQIRAIRFSSDGKSLFTAADGIYRIEWPSKQRRQIWLPRESALGSAVFSPDGSCFARASYGKETQIHLHESATGKLLRSIAAGTLKSDNALAWSRDGESVAIGGLGEILIHRIDTGERIRRIPQGATAVNAVAWSPDGKWIAAANRNYAEDGLNLPDGKTIVLLPMDGTSPPVPLPGNRGTEFSFSPDSSILAVSCEEGKLDILYLWDVAAGQALYQEKFGGGYGYRCLAHSPDGKWLAGGGRSRLSIRDAQTGEEVFLHEDEPTNAHLRRVAFSPDGSVLACAVEDRIKFFDTATWKEIDPDEDLRAPVVAMAFSADGRHLVTGGQNGDMLLWDWEKKTPAWKRHAPQQSLPIRALSLDPSGRWIGVAQSPTRPENRIVSLVDFATGKSRRYLSVDHAYSAPLFQRDRPAAFVATTSGKLVEWDCEADQALRTLNIPFLNTSKTPLHFIERLDFEPSDPLLIRWTTRLAFGRIHSESLAESLTFDVNRPYRNADPVPPRSHGFTHIGSCVWNLPTFHQVDDRYPDIDSSVIHPSELLLFIEGDTHVEVFDVLSQSRIHRIPSGPVKAMAVSPDGKTLVTATSGGVKYWSFPVEKRIVYGIGSDLNSTMDFSEMNSETLWQMMGVDQHWEAYQAAWHLSQRPDFLPIVEGGLAPAREPTPTERELLQLMLTDGNHEVRLAAARKWLDLGLVLDRAIYETLHEGGLPAEAGLAKLPISWERHIPPLIPLSDHRRAMRAVMILREDGSPESLRQLERLATGHDAALLTIAAKKAVAARTL